MKNYTFCFAVILLLIFGFKVGTMAQSGEVGKSKVKEPIDYVNPNIGSIGQLLVSTDPFVIMPQGSVKLCSNPWPEIVDRYVADKVFSFSLRDVPGFRTKTIPSWIMATTGKIEVAPAKIASNYDHDFETVTPYYSALLLENYDINVEYTGAEDAAYFRFTFPKALDSHILLGSNAKFSIINENTLEGQEAVGNRIAYFYVKFNKPITSYGTWKDETIIPKSNSQSGSNIGAYTNFPTSNGEKVEVKIGVSLENIEKAQENLEKEIPSWNFEEAKNDAKNKWKKSMSIVKVEGGTESQRTIFYTGLYKAGGGERLFGRMKLSEEKSNERAQKYATLSRKELFPQVSSDGVMFQHGNIVSITDQYLKGKCNFDINGAYENMKVEFLESTRLPWRRGPKTELDSFYLSNGFYPALPAGKTEWVPEVHKFEKRECVTLTLQAAYESWCIAQIAKDLGKQSDYEFFIKHAHDYQNVFNTQTGFMAPKTADGKWVEPFNPKLSGGIGAREYFSEMNSWIYTFYVSQDIQGLMNLMGGRTKFVKKLDDLFIEQYEVPKYTFLSQFPDMTGLIGNYAQGNEFSRLIPYLYNYGGEPWKTQRRVRDIMKIWYGTGPLGLCGDEDSGMLSTWYVYSAMGIYSDIIIPGYPIWLIGSPIFEKVTLDLGNKKTFVIEAKNVSAQNKYIQSATLNGEPLNKPWFEHSILANGGILVLKMGPRPNRQWGSSPEAVPPSMSKAN